ncbi:hypothetical protein SAMN05421736_12838 [Evansella caseinilytica]|uniref:Uncharacterized protein n=1 Tax=Evansella caseinilytica TaxID=1503961 RepID=A0A1H3UWU8_9BACI|nr:hypothetical protein SAMN05421736_12838 [Evansella caseinilytica]
MEWTQETRYAKNILKVDFSGKSLKFLFSCLDNGVHYKTIFILAYSTHKNYRCFAILTKK